MKNPITKNRIKTNRCSNFINKGKIKKSRINILAKHSAFVNHGKITGTKMNTSGENHKLTVHNLMYKSRLTFSGKNIDAFLYGEFENCNITVVGNDLTVSIYPNCRFKDCDILINSNNSILSIKRGCEFIKNKIHIINSGSTRIGENLLSTEGTMIVNRVVCGNKAVNIKIGDDCMLGYYNDIITEKEPFRKKPTVITNTDHHFAGKNGKFNNFEKGITIQDHVWIAGSSTVLKGSYIPKGCLIGSTSLIREKLGTENGYYAGNPSKLIKSNYEWKR